MLICFRGRIFTKLFIQGTRPSTLMKAIRHIRALVVVLLVVVDAAAVHYYYYYYYYFYHYYYYYCLFFYNC